MGRYLTPLPGVFAGAIEFVLNRACALDAEAPARLEPLVGRWLKFEIDGLALDLWVSTADGRFRVLAEPEHESDDATGAETTIGGTPGALLGMAVPALGVDGGVRISGDAQLAQRFQQVMKALDPDIEKGLSEYFGEFFGPQMFRLVSDAVDAARTTFTTAGDQAARWFRDESALVPHPGEWRRFSDEVDRLREATDRLERRVKRAGRA